MTESKVKGWVIQRKDGRFLIGDVMEAGRWSDQLHEAVVFTGKTKPALRKGEIVRYVTRITTIQEKSNDH